MTSAIIGSGSFKSSYFNAIIFKCTEVHNFNNGTFPTITLHQSDQPDSLLFNSCILYSEGDIPYFDLKHLLKYRASVIPTIIAI